MPKHTRDEWKRAITVSAIYATSAGIVLTILYVLFR